MRDTTSAYNFIKRNGSIIEVSRLNAITQNKQPDPLTIAELQKIQNKDGGFPYKNILGSISTINNTLVCINWMHDLKLIPSPMANKSFQFLFERERADGTWQESESIVQYGPPSWMDPRNRDTIIYTTSLSLFWLLVSKILAREKFQFFSKVLESFQEPNGIFRGSLTNHWLGTASLAMLTNWENERVQKGIQYIQHVANKLSASDLSWLLVTLLLAGRSPKDRLIVLLSDQLFQMQKLSGEFESDDGSIFTVDTTLQAVKVASLLGML